MPADGTVPTVRIGGIPITALSYEEALGVFLGAPAAGRRLAVHFCTAHTIVESTTDPRLRSGLVDGGFDVPDGVPLTWVGRLRGHRIERVCGLDVLPDLADRGRTVGLRHFFYGGDEGAAQQLASRLIDRFPGMIVAGTETPPFRPLTPEEDAAMVGRLNAARPDVVWVGLGTPKQDFWLADNRDRLNASVLMAVGAAFDIVGGRRPRAPRIMQRTGLEWLYRLYQEPRRLLRRYTSVNAQFVAIAVADIVHDRRPRHADGRRPGPG